jgi:thiol-disulfide isomerase/thioredoxin
MKRGNLIVTGVIITAAVAVASIALLTLTSPSPTSPPASPRAPKSGVASIGQLHWSESPQVLPATAFSDEKGTSRTLRDFAGRVLVVNFWATWCEPCVREMPSLDALEASLGGEKFGVVAINQDRNGAEVAQPFLAEHGWSHLALYTDPRSQAVRDMAVRGLPTSLIVDGQGREVARLEGSTTWDSPEMVASLQKLIGQD